MVASHRKGFMKIKFESDDNLPLGKMLIIRSMIIVAVPVFEKDGKYYPQVCYMNVYMSYENVAMP